MTLLGCDIDPGIYPDLSMEDYHGGPGLSSTELKPILDSVDDFVHGREHDDISIGARHLGCMLHDAVFTAHDEPDHSYRFYDKTKSRRAKTYKRFCEEHDCIGVFADDLEMVTSIRRQLDDHPRLRAVLSSDGIAEASYFAEIDGVLCKCRPDFVVEGDRGDFLFDLKSTRKGKAHPDRWGYEVMKRDYHFSAAMYRAVYESATNRPVTAFAHIVVEKSAPYLVAGHNLGADTLETGRIRFRRALDKYQRWKAGEIEYTGYTDGGEAEFFTTEIPDYALETP